MEDSAIRPLHKKISFGILIPLTIVFVVSMTVGYWLESRLYEQTAKERLSKLKIWVSKQVLSIANTAALGIDGEKHAEIFGYSDYKLKEFEDIRNHLRNIIKVNAWHEELYTLRMDEPEKRLAQFVVMSGEKPYIGTKWEYPMEVESVMKTGISTCTDIYRSKSKESRRWMSAFAAIKEPDSELNAVLTVDFSVEDLMIELEKELALTRFYHYLRTLGLALLFAIVYLLIFFIVRNNVSRLIAAPLRLVVNFAHKVRDGVLKSDLALRSGDELELLANSMNEMVDGLRTKETMSRFLTTMALEEISAVADGGKELLQGGENKMITILFSDIRSFTTICEKEEPSKVVLALNTYFNHVIPIIEKHGGSLDKLIGDAVMAVFESKPGFNDADAALKAAIEIQSCAKALRPKLEAMELPQFHAGFGINSGVSIVGNVGTINTLSRTVLGDAVNLAARVESLSKEGKQSCILFTHFTEERIEHDFRYEFLKQTVVKGKSEAVRVFEINTDEMIDYKLEQ
jgi:class 3 adenylate cyclase